MLRKAGDAIGALALVTLDNPMCPGTGHRICNDCMKSCIYQKQEPVNIPQIETGVLTDVLQLPWGVEIYGLLTRWNPLNVRRPYALPYNGKNVLVVGLGPGRLHAGALPGERRLRRRRHRRPEDRAAAGGDRRHRRRAAPADSRLERDLSPARRARARRLRRRVGVRHHRALGQELPHAAAPDAGAAPRLQIYGGVRFGGTLPIEDAWALRLRSRGDRRRRRTADDHRHEEQPDPRHPEGQRLPDGAAAHRRVQARRAAEPAGAAAGGRDRRRPDGDRHRDRADGVLPAAGREDAAALRHPRRRSSARRASAALYDAEELELLDEYLAHGRAVRAERARAEAAGEAPDFVPLVRGLGRRHDRLPQADGRFAGVPPEPRRGDQGARGRHRVRREPEPDRSRARRARRRARR